MDAFDNLSRSRGRLVSELVTRSRLVLMNRNGAGGALVDYVLRKKTLLFGIYF